jgi:CheY-like chemotaxis protein
VDGDKTSTFLSQWLLHRLSPTLPLLVAANGAQGLHLLQHELTRPVPAEPTFWLVLLDLPMPMHEGFNFLQTYQQLPPAQRQRVAVVVLHGHGLGKGQPFEQGLLEVDDLGIDEQGTAK